MSALVWFRRDLRADDHAALAHALGHHDRVWCAFVFDREILDPLLAAGLKVDRRVEFILRAVAELDAALKQRGGGLIVRHGFAREEIPRLAAELGIATACANRDYEPAARDRDAEVARRLAADGREWRDFKDQVIFERDEVLTGGGKPYGVFTPYRNAWLKRLAPADLMPHDTEQRRGILMPPPAAAALPTLEGLGFAPTNLASLALPTGMSGGRRLLDDVLERMDD